MIEIKCVYDKLVAVDQLRLHPKNPNKHSDEQIARLAKIIQYQGIRRPVRVSNLSGCIVAGHGLLLALQSLGELTAPINFQDYESEEQEFADLVADNSIASWADLDFAAINLEVPDLGPDFDIDLLGMKSFFLDASERGTDPNKEWSGMPEFTQDDKTAYQSVALHFHNQKAIDQFSKLIKQTITEKTRSIWYPEKIIDKAFDKRYAAES